ncbi:MAG: hypothetical protein MUF15_03040 [Acidobacteria bacterium]|jgi:uncharacterized protein (TIGR02646 family)|nr:hypothetical protein [Acidobacteriota bacterium]
MRYIDIDKIKIPDGWKEKAEKALRDIEKLPVEERKKQIAGKSDLWAELKKPLAELSHYKCWYCETPNIREDFEVDHFRPKNNIKDSNLHQGYWWLAFSWENYRYSCTFCNCRRADCESGIIKGKGDYFPLLDESNRCFCQSDDLKKESPLLLDPINPLDPGLIIFTQDGCAQCKYSKGENEIEFKRAEKSIELYHLNESRLVEKRKELHRKLKALIDQGDEEFTNINRNALSSTFKELRKLINEKSEYSSAAKFFLLGYRDKNRDWVDMVIQCS